MDEIDKYKILLDLVKPFTRVIVKNIGDNLYSWKFYFEDVSNDKPLLNQSESSSQPDSISP